ncbi:MAG: aminoacyl-tRNA hydrolase [Planctomycetes bacterium GWF2_50_10]|nr:MAG: aminoacyl-tRNA hydrolase [Planctomycetes bacterium GWF2_50_10]
MGIFEKLFKAENKAVSQVKIVVGLGNPGREYEGTRHNAGFDVLDEVAKAAGIEMRSQKFSAEFGQGEYKGKKLILLKPQQYMNRSGQSVATAMGFYKLAITELLVVADDLALEPGVIRLRAKGSAGGHNGLGDIISKLGSEDFARLRVGIGKAVGISRDYVLMRPDGEQAKLLKDATDRAKEAVLCWVDKGIDAAMNKFNKDPEAKSPDQK